MEERQDGEGEGRVEGEKTVEGGGGEGGGRCLQKSQLLSALKVMYQGQNDLVLSKSIFDAGHCRYVQYVRNQISHNKISTSL